MDKSNHIGAHIRIELLDHCALPREIFPLRGTVVRRLRAIGGADDWYLIELGESFEYQKKIGEPYRYKLFRHNRVLVRSRWDGHEVGEPNETSVFLLLLPPDFSVEDDSFDPDHCDHVAWCLSFTEGTEPQAAGGHSLRSCP